MAVQYNATTTWRTAVQRPDEGPGGTGQCRTGLSGSGREIDAGGYQSYPGRHLLDFPEITTGKNLHLASMFWLSG